MVFKGRSHAWHAKTAKSKHITSLKIYRKKQNNQQLPLLLLYVKQFSNVKFLW